MVLLDTLRNIIAGTYMTPSVYDSFFLPYTEQYIAESEALLAEIGSAEHMAVVGIGGSNLGTMAIYSALKAHTAKNRTLHFFDTTDPDDTTETLAILVQALAKGERVIVTTISKSGWTTETVALSGWLCNALAPYASQVTYVAITEQDSKLDQVAHRENWKCLYLPKTVGGRYSVFSNVGIFPLLFAGIDMKLVLLGAQNAIADAVQSGQEHIAYQVAQEITQAFPHRNIFEHWFFAKRLENLGKWYRQLLAESIGKIRKTDSVGITPVVSLGTIDLHSVAQLSLAHGNDRSIAVIHDVSHTTTALEASPILEILPHLVGKQFTDIMNAARHGFVDACQQKYIPLYEYTLDTSRPQDIGYFLQTKMIEVALMAEMFGINGFDQPNVEDYKKGMERELGKK